MNEIYEAISKVEMSAKKVTFYRLGACLSLLIGVTFFLAILFVVFVTEEFWYLILFFAPVLIIRKAMLIFKYIKYKNS